MSIPELVVPHDGKLCAVGLAATKLRLDLGVQRRHLVAGLLAIRAQARTPARGASQRVKSLHILCDDGGL